LEKQGSLSQWLEERCQREHLTLRQAAAKTGLSHATIADIRKGNRPFPETIKKLAQAFGGDGPNQRFALEDYLLTLAGYRTPRPDEQELSQPLARLIDRLREFSEPQLKIMACFADFLMEIESIKYEAKSGGVKEKTPDTIEERTR
jgi:transcriptional regulator with XRE-family HTH domain